jgi:hypothetical protein
VSEDVKLPGGLVLRASPAGVVVLRDLGPTQIEHVCTIPWEVLRKLLDEFRYPL